MRCRICSSDKLTKFLDLGFTPPADDFLLPPRLNQPETFYPLDLYICSDCSLVQLGYVVAGEILFQKDYPYESSMTDTGVKHFHAFADEACEELKLASGDLAVDIGSNVGVLLEGFKKNGLRVLGVDPAANICETARERGINTINGFFSRESVKKILESEGKARVVTGTNVVAHIDDLHSLIKNVSDLLDKKGIFIFEAPYLVSLIENLEYDTVYHEHLSYLSVKPLVRLFEQFDMEIFQIKPQEIHGGSLRYFAARKNDYKPARNMNDWIEMEKKKKIYDLSTLDKFAEDVGNNRKELTWLLQSLKKEGKRIAGVGAPAKGMTLLNYCKIGRETLDFITEKSRLKIGRFTPGTHIPVTPDAMLLEEKPDFALLLPWNFAGEIMNNLSAYKNNGGKFIIPIPKPHIIG